MKEVAKGRRRAFENNDQGRALQTLVCKIKQGHDALSEVDAGGALAIYIQRLRLSRQFEHNTVEGAAQIGSRDRYALGVRQRTECVPREQCGQEIERRVVLLRADGCDATLTLLGIVRRKRRRCDIGEVSASVLTDDGARRTGKRRAGRVGRSDWEAKGIIGRGRGRVDDGVSEAIGPARR